MTYLKTFATGLVAAAVTAGMAMAQDAKVIGVSIPAATHGWAGGMNFHAQEAVKRLEEVYPELDFVLATASDPGKQVNDIEDMVATRNISALVVLPFESEPLTSPVQAVAEGGATAAASASPHVSWPPGAGIGAATGGGAGPAVASSRGR